MTETHLHEHPPTHLSSAANHSDLSLPEREILTPMGKSRFRNADLERDGYRYSFSRDCDEKLVEIIYLKSDGTTGTVISDLDSLFDTKIATDSDGNPICRVTFKLLKVVTSPVQLHCADVPISSFNDGVVNRILRKLLDHFLKQVYGREDTEEV